MRHGFWCNARTIPMRCRCCGTNPIFWFSCECGCSVLWDDLGPPWPNHRCFRGYSHGDVDSVEEQILAPARLPWTDSMAAVPPGDEAEEFQVTGIVGGRVLERNITKKFGVEDTPSGRLLLGPLGGFRPGTVTVHTIHPLAGGQLPRRESVTAWTSRTKLRGLQIGDPVRMKVEAHRVRGELIWVVTALKAIFSDWGRPEASNDAVSVPRGLRRLPVSQRN